MSGYKIKPIGYRSFMVDQKTKDAMTGLLENGYNVSHLLRKAIVAKWEKVKQESNDGGNDNG